MTAFLVMETQITLALFCVLTRYHRHTACSPFRDSEQSGVQGLLQGPTEWDEGSGVGGVGVLVIPRCALTKPDWALHMQLFTLEAMATHGLLSRWSATSSPYCDDLWSRHAMDLSSKYFLFHLAMILSSCHWFSPVCFWNKQLTSKANSSFCFAPCHQALVCIIVWGKVEVEWEGCACSPQEHSWKFRQWLCS